MSTQERIRVWDPAVRIFHWSLVVSFAVAYLSAEDEGMLHIYSGYVVMGLVAFRLLWGVFGTRHARFSDFVFGPGEVIAYLRSLRTGHPRHYLGHNPLGGWMVIALLVSLIAVSWTGLEQYATEGKGPLAAQERTWVSTAWASDDERETGRRGREGGEGDEFWEEVHELIANGMLVLIFLHIGGVVLSSRAHRENLVKAMFTGYKNR